MHTHNLDPWIHPHVFLGKRHSNNERRVWIVVALTVVMMTAEIAGGNVYGSLALVADGWHMATHAAALSIAGLAYFYARRHQRDPRFSFGTGKFGELAAFASAIILGMIAVMVAYESAVRFFHPVEIDFVEAVSIAVLGLAVNLASAWLLRDEHSHDHDHHDHHHRDHDNNLRSAYVHVLADAATSVLAIFGLLAAWSFGWTWADPAVGFVGTVVIAIWAYGLIRAAGGVLLDVVPDLKLEKDIRARLETGGDRISDLHLWQVGPGHCAVVAAIVTDDPRPPTLYKERLADLNRLSHVTIEVCRCPDHADAA
jgi:cation diffusion facilitator family transporter